MKIIKKLDVNVGPLVLLLLFYLLNPFNYGFLFGYPIVLLLLVKKNFVKNNLDIDFLLLFLFSLIYGLFYIFDPFLGNQYIIVYMLFPPVFYLLGKYITSKLNQTTDLFYILIVIGVIFSFPALVSVLLNIAEKGLGQIDRSIPMFWNGQILSATIMGAYFTLNMCIPALMVAKQLKIHYLTKGVLLTIFVLSLLCVLRIGTRTQIVICLITLLAALIFIVPRQSFKTNVILFLIFFISIFFIVQNVSFDLSSDWLSAFADRMGNNGGSDIASGGGRTSRWLKSLKYIFVKPLGWDVNEFGYSHNLWLDILRFSGIIPFLILIIFSVRSFFSIKRAIAANKTLLTLNNQLKTYALAFFLIFMVEPVFEGIYPIFILFCLFIGMVNKYYITMTRQTNKRSRKIKDINS